MPGFNPSIQVADTATKTLRFRVRPRGFAIERVWGLVLRASTAAPTVATVTAPAGTGTPVDFVLSPTGGLYVVPFAYLETLSARSSTEAEISISVESNGGALEWEWVSCHEQDRAALADNSTDYGVRVDTIVPRAPIINVTQTSLRGVYDLFANMDARRVGILHTALDTSEPYQVTSASFSSLTTLPYKIQVPKLNAGATEQDCKWACYARMATSGGSGGSVRLTTSVSGVSDTATITGTSFAWTASRTISVACDDFSAVDGFRDDELTIEIAGDGTRTVEVASVSIWVDTVA